MDQADIRTSVTSSDSWWAARCRRLVADREQCRASFIANAQSPRKCRRDNGETLLFSHDEGQPWRDTRRWHELFLTSATAIRRNTR